jgi:hypothetical protein
MSVAPRWTCMNEGTIRADDATAAPPAVTRRPTDWTGVRGQR